VKSKFIVVSQKNLSSKLSSVPVRKHVDIFVSKLDPCVPSSLLESELFNGYSDVTINKMVTKHPSYSSFHVRLPAEKLDIFLDPAFWPDGVMVKRFWGRLTPEMVQNTTPKKLYLRVRLPLLFLLMCMFRLLPDIVLGNYPKSKSTWV